MDNEPGCLLPGGAAASPAREERVRETAEALLDALHHLRNARHLPVDHAPEAGRAAVPSRRMSFDGGQGGGAPGGGAAGGAARKTVHVKLIGQRQHFDGVVAAVMGRSSGNAQPGRSSKSWGRRGSDSGDDGGNGGFAPENGSRRRRSSKAEPRFSSDSTDDDWTAVMAAAGGANGPQPPLATASRGRKLSGELGSGPSNAGFGGASAPRERRGSMSFALRDSSLAAGGPQGQAQSGPRQPLTVSTSQAANRQTHRGAAPSVSLPRSSSIAASGGQIGAWTNWEDAGEKVQQFLQPQPPQGPISAFSRRPSIGMNPMSPSHSSLHASPHHQPSGHSTDWAPGDSRRGDGGFVSGGRRSLELPSSSTYGSTGSFSPGSPPLGASPSGAFAAQQSIGRRTLPPISGAGASGAHRVSQQVEQPGPRPSVYMNAVQHVRRGRAPPPRPANVPELTASCVRCTHAEQLAAVCAR